MIHQPIETQVIIAATIGGMVILNAATCGSCLA
jgi:hypothetical protein